MPKTIRDIILFFSSALIGLAILTFFFSSNVFAGCSQYADSYYTKGCNFGSDCPPGCDCIEGAGGATRYERPAQCIIGATCGGSWAGCCRYIASWGPSCAPVDCGCPGPPSRPCGDCIPSGCGFTVLPLEKKFVIDNKTSDEIQQLFLRSAQFNRSTMTAENNLSRATSVVSQENSSNTPDGKNFLASIFEPSLKTIRNFLSRLII